VRILLQKTPGWQEFAECFPKAWQAIEELPDCSMLYGLNPMVQDVICDAVCRVKGLGYGSIKTKDLVGEAKEQDND
jgi:hypothetical protein